MALLKPLNREQKELIEGATSDLVELDTLIIEYDSLKNPSREETDKFAVRYNKLRDYLHRLVLRLHDEPLPELMTTDILRNLRRLETRHPTFLGKMRGLRSVGSYIPLMSIYVRLVCVNYLEK